MQHLDDGTLHELVDGEISSDRLGPIRAHLDACADCRVRLDDARAMAAESDDLVGVLEVPPTERTSAGAEERKGAGAQERRGAGSATVTARFPVRTLAWAASIALAAWLGNRAGGPRLHPPEPPAAPQTITFDSTTRLGQEADPAVPQAEAPLQRTRAERPVPPPTADADDRRNAVELGRREAAGDTTRREELRLDEIVSTASPRRALEQAAAPAAEPPAGRVAERQLGAVAQRSQAKAVVADALEAEAAFVTVEFADAVARLGGAIRLVGGLVPARLEAAGAVVRVVYPLAEGSLLLEQWRSGDTLAVRLSGPVSADSLVVLRGRIR